MFLKKCILCRKDKYDDEFNEEYVFPDSIWEEYTIFSLCKECNSYLESHNKFSKSSIVRLLNHELRITNKMVKLFQQFHQYNKS